MILKKSSLYLEYDRVWSLSQILSHYALSISQGVYDIPELDRLGTCSILTLSN